ncbi:hypothetical protein [Spirosoma areae]
MPLPAIWLLAASLLALLPAKHPPKSLLNDLKSPILFRGDERTAYRDPAMLYHQNTLYVFLHGFGQRPTERSTPIPP